MNRKPATEGARLFILIIILGAATLWFGVEIFTKAAVPAAKYVYRAVAAALD